MCIRCASCYIFEHQSSIKSYPIFIATPIPYSYSICIILHNPYALFMRLPWLHTSDTHQVISHMHYHAHPILIFDISYEYGMCERERERDILIFDIDCTSHTHILHNPYALFMRLHWLHTSDTHQVISHMHYHPYPLRNTIHIRYALFLISHMH